MLGAWANLLHHVFVELFWVDLHRFIRVLIITSPEHKVIPDTPSIKFIFFFREAITVASFCKYFRYWLVN